MINKKKIAVIGGDTRQLAVADFFSLKGYSVTVWGIESDGEHEGCSFETSLKKALCSADILILPLPLSTDSIRLNAPMYEGDSVKITDLGELIPSGRIVYVGKATEEFKNKCKEKNIICVDYFEDECLCIKNALLTAEASADILMRELPFSVDSSRVMIIGYGRVGKLLTNLLLRLNANVTVAARRKEDLAYAECIGAKTVRIDESKRFRGLLEINNGYDVVFNTVPVNMIDRELIKDINKNVILIDLASPPGGVDIRAAKEYKINTIWALSLPGKFSPHRAGHIIAEAILDDLEGN